MIILNEITAESIHIAFTCQQQEERLQLVLHKRFMTTLFLRAVSNEPRYTVC